MSRKQETDTAQTAMQGCQPLKVKIHILHLQNSYFSTRIRIFNDEGSKSKPVTKQIHCIIRLVLLTGQLPLTADRQLASSV